MPEHVHLLVYPGAQARATSRFLQYVKQSVAQKAITYLRRHAPAWLPKLAVREGKRIRYRFWQPGEGYDRNVTNVATLRAMIEYVRANPVRRGLVERPEDYAWSSARWFAGIRPAKLEMDALVLQELAGESVRRC